MKRPVCPFNFMEANLRLSRGDAECLEHLKRMYAGFSVQIGKILRSYDEN
jgi:hypothetical protein